MAETHGQGMRSEVGDQAERVPEAAVMLDKLLRRLAVRSVTSQAMGQANLLAEFLISAASAMRRGRPLRRSQQTRSRLMPPQCVPACSCSSGRPVFGASAMSRSAPGQREEALVTADKWSIVGHPPYAQASCRFSVNQIPTFDPHWCDMPDNWGLLRASAAAEPADL